MSLILMKLSDVTYNLEKSIPEQSWGQTVLIVFKAGKPETKDETGNFISFF